MASREHFPVDFQALAEFRYQIRRYVNFSERAARSVGLEPQQYQALLTLKGMPRGRRPTIGAFAERLHIRHHSAVELVDRLESQRLLQRSRNSDDRREVFLQLSRQGERLLRRLAVTHRAELRAAGPALLRALESVISLRRPAARSHRQVLQNRSARRMKT